MLLPAGDRCREEAMVRQGRCPVSGGDTGYRARALMIIAKILIASPVIPSHIRSAQGTYTRGLVAAFGIPSLIYFVPQCCGDLINWD